MKRKYFGIMALSLALICSSVTATVTSAYEPDRAKASSWAFAYNKRLQKVTGGEDVRFVGRCAFDGLVKMKNLPEFVYNGKNCKYYRAIFRNMKSLKKVVLPKDADYTLTMFKKCTDLKYAEVKGAGLYLSGKAITSLNFSPLKNNPIYSLSVERAACRSMDLSPLKTCKLKVLSLKDCGVNSLNFQPLATSPLHKLYVINCPLKKIDVSPLKNTLTELWLGTLQNTYFWEEINHKQTKPKYQLLDLSKMKKLKRVYACGVASLKTVKLKDTKTKQGIRSLLELHLYGTGIRTLDATAAKNLKRLFVGDRIRKLTVDKCKKLKEIGVINLGSKQAATIKSSSVQHIQYQGKTLKKLSFSKCPKLYTLSIKCTKVGTVNLRSNKRLHYMTLNSKKTGKVVYPKVSTKGWHDCCDLVETNYYKNLDEYKNDPDAKGVYKEYVGYILEYPTKILDISAWTSFNKTVKRCMFGYGDFDHEKCATKKIIINKKLRKADKKWIKKFAKKWHVKVVEK